MIFGEAIVIYDNIDNIVFCHYHLIIPEITVDLQGRVRTTSQQAGNEVGIKYLSFGAFA